MKKLILIILAVALGLTYGYLLDTTTYTHTAEVIKYIVYCLVFIIFFTECK